MQSFKEAREIDASIINYIKSIRNRSLENEDLESDGEDNSLMKCLPAFEVSSQRYQGTSLDLKVFFFFFTKNFELCVFFVNLKVPKKALGTLFFLLHLKQKKKKTFGF